MAVPENPNRKGMLFAGTGHGVLLLAGRRQALDAVLRRTSRAPPCRGSSSRSCSTTSSSRRTVAASSSCATSRRSSRPGHDRRRGRRSISAASRLSASAQRTRRRHVRAQDGVAAAGASRDSRFGERGRAHDAGADARRLNRAIVGSALRPAEASSALRTAAPDNPHIFDEPRFRQRRRGRSRIGEFRARRSRGRLALAGQLHGASHREREDADAVVDGAEGSRDQDRRSGPRRVDARRRCACATT